MAVVKALDVTVATAGTAVQVSSSVIKAQSVVLFVPTGDLVTLGGIDVVHATNEALPVNIPITLNSTDPLNPLDLSLMWADAAANGDRLTVYYVEA